MVQAVSLKCGNRKWPSFWGAHCSHRTESLERNDVLIYIESEISGLNSRRWFTTCVPHLTSVLATIRLCPTYQAFQQYRGRRNIKCEPPKTVAPPLTDQTTPINNLCWVLNHSLGLYKWRHQGDFEISTPVQNYSTKTLFLWIFKISSF